LSLDPRDAGSNLAEAMDFLRAVKVHSITSFGWEAEPEASCHKFLQHIKDLV
jgi:hypothetical protein